MEVILTSILAHVSIWAPSLVAILGIVATVVIAINKTLTAINNLKNSADFAAVTKKLNSLAAENQELARVNKLLLERITKIKDYADLVKKEEE